MSIFDDPDFWKPKTPAGGGGGTGTIFDDASFWGPAGAATQVAEPPPPPVEPEPLPQTAPPEPAPSDPFAQGNIFAGMEPWPNAPRTPEEMQPPQPMPPVDPSDPMDMAGIEGIQQAPEPPEPPGPTLEEQRNALLATKHHLYETGTGDGKDILAINLQLSDLDKQMLHEAAQASPPEVRKWRQEQLKVLPEDDPARPGLLLAEAIDRVRELREKREKVDKGFFDRASEIKDYIGERVLPFVGNVKDLIDSREVAKAQERISSGQGMELDYFTLARTIVEASEAQDAPVLKQALDIATRSIGYAGEFYLTGGAYAGAKGATEKLIASQLGRSRGLMKAGDWLLPRLVGSAAQAAADVPMVLSSTERDRLGEYTTVTDANGNTVSVDVGKPQDFVKSLPRGFVKAFLEMASERSGGVVSRAIGLEGLRKAFVSRLLKKGWEPGAISRALKLGGWNGILPEMLEERVRDIGALITRVENMDENTVGQLLSGDAAATMDALKQIGIEGLGFAALGGGGMAAESLATKASAAENGRRPRFYPEIAGVWASQNPDTAAAVANLVTSGKKKLTRGDLEKLGVPGAGGSTQKQRAEFGQRVKDFMAQQAPQPQQEATNAQKVRSDQGQVYQGGQDVDQGVQDQGGPDLQRPAEVGPEAGYRQPQGPQKGQVAPQPQPAGQEAPGVQEPIQTPQGETQAPPQGQIEAPPVGGAQEGVRQPVETAPPQAEQPIEPPEAAPPSSLAELQPQARQAAEDDTLTLYEPEGDQESDASDFAAERGKRVVFYTNQGRKGLRGFIVPGDTDTVYIQRGQEGDALWRVLGHELAHATGFDVGSKADEQLIEEFADKRLANTPDNYKEQVRKTPDLRRREGIAEMAGEFLKNKKFRDELARTNPNLWQRLRDGILKIVSKFSPRTAAWRETIQALRDAKLPTKEESRKSAAKIQKERLKRAEQQIEANRYWDYVSERAKKVKGKTGPVTVDRGEQKDEPGGKIEWTGEILSDTWAIVESPVWDELNKRYVKWSQRPDKDIKRNYILTHRPSGRAITSARTSKALKEFWVHAQDAGVDFSKISDSKSGEEYAKEVGIRNIERNWDGSDLSFYPDEKRKQILALTPAAPEFTGKADVVLDSKSLAVGTNLEAAGTGDISLLAKEVPEFLYDPVFTVDEKKNLVYRDGYKFSFKPERFNLDPSELEPGQTVGVNIADLGYKPATEQDVVAGALKNQGFKVTKSKSGTIKASWGITKADVSQVRQHQWTASGAKGVKDRAQKVIESIRWTQPGERGQVPSVGGKRTEEDTLYGEKGEPRKSKPAGKKGGGGSGSASAASAFRRGEGGAGSRPPGEEGASPTGAILERLRGIRAPELFELAKEMMGGKIPLVKRLGRALGRFRYMEGLPESVQILLDPRSAKNEHELAAVIAHEIGHLTDYLPDWTLKRGNILGRIASLRGYLKHFMAGKPGGPGPLEKDDLKRLRALAKELTRDPEGVTKKAEQELDITAKDIIAIWNSLDTSLLPPQLVEYVKKFSDAEKHSIIKEAFRGIVRDEVKDAVRRLTEAKQEEAPDLSWKTKYDELIKEEIRKRELLSRSTIRGELIALTKWWSGDYVGMGSGYRRYRESSRELYAEALSVFLVDPAQLEARAPMFWRGFTEYLSSKPEALDAYLVVQDLINGTPSKLATDRSIRIRSMFSRTNEIIQAAMNSRQAARKSVHESLAQQLEMRLIGAEQYLLERGAPIRSLVKKAQKAGVEIDPAQNAYYILDELNTIEAANHEMLARIQREVYEPALEQGFTPFDMGEYLFLRRIVNERYEILNPLLFTPGEAAKQLAGLRDRLGAEKFKRLEGAMGIWHDIIYESSIERAVESGVYSRKNLEEKIKPNRDNYAAFAVAHYLENNAHISAGLFRQVGTTEEIANPLDATHMKMITLNRLSTLNQAKRSVRDFLRRNFPDQITDVPVPYGEREPKGIPRPGMEYLLILEDGKPTAVEVPKILARSFLHHDIGSMARHAAVLESKVYANFHPLYVTYNPGFQTQNPIRDLRRTHVSLGDIGDKLHNELVRDLMAVGKTKKEAKELAKPQKITLLQVLKAYWDARGPAWRRAAGIQDNTIDRLIREHAIDVPFVSVDPSVIEHEGATKYLLEQHGLSQGKDGQTPGMIPWVAGKIAGTIESVPGGSAITKPIKKSLAKAGGVVEAVGVFEETLPKVAADILLRKRGVVARERAFIVRKYPGTPDYKQRGLYTAATNSVWMYQKVRVNGMQWDADLALGKDTAFGWWWRRFNWALMPTTITKAAAYGLLGPSLAKMFAAIPKYFIDNYDIFPLGWIMGGDDDDDDKKKGKVVFLTVAQDDTGRIIKNIYSKMIDMAAESAGIDARYPSAGKVRQELFGDISADTIGTFNPLIDISWKWFQYGRGINPRDEYFGSEIVPPTEWGAQGWPATKKMLSWTVDKFGVLSTMAHSITGPTVGSPFESGQETTVETISRSVPGLSRMLRVSDRGYSETQWAEAEAAEMESARFRADLPEEVRQTTSALYRLQRRVDELSPREKYQKALLQKWYSTVYTPLTKEMKEDGDNSELLDRLKNETKELQKALQHKQANLPDRMLGSLAADLVRLMPERKIGEKQEKYDERVADWKDTVNAARGALTAAGATDIGKLRNAVDRVRSERGETTLKAKGGKLTDYGQRLNRIASRLREPVEQP